MSTNDNWSESPRNNAQRSTNGTQRSTNEKSVRKLRRRNFARAMQLEKFEDRLVMAGEIGQWPYEISPVGVNDSNQQVWSECRSPGYYFVTSNYGKTCSTSLPVTIQNAGLSAPDGATVQPSESSDLFTPKNGLLTLQNGQDALTATYGQQQLVTFKTNYFPANTINPLDKPMSGATLFNSTIKVAVSGNYTFYLTGTYNTERIKVGDKSLQLPYAGGVDKRTSSMVVPLAAGVSYPFEALYDFGGYAIDIPKAWSVEWSGPNLTRQSITPASDVSWSNTSWSGRDGKRGFIPVGANFSADKTATDGAFMLRYTTSFSVPATGEYTFSLNSDNAASIKFGNDVVLQKTASGESSAKRTLTAGTTVNMEVIYIHQTGTRSLDLQWSGPQLSRRAFIPTNPLKYEYFEGNFSLNTSPLPAPKKADTMFVDIDSMALSWNGQTTPAFKMGASAEEVQKLLNGLSNIGGAGGNVRVTYSESDSTYKVLFGGNTWYRPPLLVPVGSSTVYVQAVTVAPVSQRDPKNSSSIKLRESLTNRSPFLDTTNMIVTDLPTAGAIPIDNAPLFTPSRFIALNTRTSSYRPSEQLTTLRGAVQVNNVSGSFELARTDPNFYNAVVTPTGIRLDTKGYLLTRKSLRGWDSLTSEEQFGFTGSDYILNPLKDATGNSRPITFLKLGGLSFEAPAGTRAKLVSRDTAGDDLQMVSQGASMLVTAPFEGGRLTLELTGTGTVPIYTANMRTGEVIVTKNVRFVSVEIGGIVIPPSDAFRMTYDAASDQFNFSINNLKLESPYPTGPSIAAAMATSTESFTQTFESYGITAAGTTYESVALPKEERWTSIAKFEAMPNKRTGSLPFYDPLHGIPGFYDSTPNLYRDSAFAPTIYGIGARYKGSLKLPQTGEYTFETGNSDRAQLKINDVLVIQDAVGVKTGKITLKGDTEHTFEYTVLGGAAGALSQNYLKVSLGSYQQYLQWLSSVASPTLGTYQYDYVYTRGPFAFGYYYNAEAVRAEFESQIRRRVELLAIPAADKARISRDLSVKYDQNKVTITGLPVPLVMPENLYKTTYNKIFANPVRIAVPSGTISISKGVLSSITGFGVDSFEIGQTTLDSRGVFKTVFEPIKPTSAGGFKLAFFQRNTYDEDGAVNVPGNSFGIYGNQTQLPLNAAGVKLNGLADLGTADEPGLIVTNGQFNRLTYAIPDVTVGSMVFNAAAVGSARPLTVNYLAPQTSNRKSYVVLGGAVLKAGSGVITTDMKANFGGMGSDGLRIYPDDNSFTFSFGVADTFLAGTQAIQSAPGVNGLRLVYDPNTKSYNFQGNGVLDFNPTTPHTATDLEFTGTKLDITATAPSGVTGFAPNRLDSATLNFFFGDRASVNGFVFAPRPTTNPLRVTITKENGELTENVGGAFTMSLDGGKLFGVMETTSFTNAEFPTDGFSLDFSPVPGQPSGFSVAGIALDDAKKSILTDTLKLSFDTAKLDGNAIAQNAIGQSEDAAEPVIVEAKLGRITRAEVASTIEQQIGDFAFKSFAAKFVSLPAGSYWNITGPAAYFGKSVNVGFPAPGNPQLRIGGDPKTGFQLRTIDKPVAPQLPGFQLPETIEIAGLVFDTNLMQEAEAAIDAGALGKTFSLKASNFSVRVGNTTLKLDLNVKVKVSTAGAEIVSFTGTGVQSSAFTVGNASFQVKTLTVEYLVSSKELRLSGQARFTFKAKGANVDMSVTLGSKAEPGLIIKSGSIESLKVKVDGSFEILKLTVKATELTVVYQQENQEFSIFGDLQLSTAPQGGIQVIKDLTVSLGTESAPGIKIANGSLDSLDIKINGEINLFKVTAAPKDLHISYTASKNLVQITGELSVTLATNFTLTAALPGDGLLIDTNTGKVQVRGLSLRSAGDITFGKLAVKGLHVDYEEKANGEVTISGAGEVALPSGFAAGGSFKIVNGKLDSIGIVLEKNPGILLANGLVNIYRIEASVEGLTNLDNFKLTGSVSATVGPLVKYGGQSYALADVKGTVVITQQDLTIKGDVIFVGGKFGNGNFAGVLSWTDVARVTFDADVRLYPGDILRGKIKAYADIKGNVDFNAQMGVFVPKGIPLVGGVSMGQLNVELRVRPAEEPSASYAKFGFSDIAVTAIRVPTFHGSVRIGFDKLVDYSFGARFFIPLPWPLPNIDYSIDVGGRFELRDADDPRVEILAASSLSGTPNGEILYATATTLPDDTTIDIYADRDNLGNDGLLIASSIPYRAGTQTFTWENMAAFAKPGEPVYVYAVVNDQQHAKGYSEYSPRFNAAPGFQPTATAPTKINFMAGDVATFSAAAGNAIVIKDPRRSVNADSEVEVVLEVGGGTLDLSHVAQAVRYSGAGTSTLTLRGSADAINAAIDGLQYVQYTANSNHDALTVSVRNLPLENSAFGATATVELVPGSVALGLLASQAESPATEITANRDDQFPLADLEIQTYRSSSVVGAKIKINGYEPGKDQLGLSLGEELETGVDAIFDEATGVLTLTGFDWTEDYEQALQAVRFQTSSMANGKSLTVSLSDDNGEIGILNVPLGIVAGHVAPRLNLTTSGFQLNLGTNDATLDPESSIEVAAGSIVRRLVVEFVQGSYIAGEDSLSGGSGTIQGRFDAVSGRLVLTGIGSASDWSQVLADVQYHSIAGKFTEGYRYLQITVEDNAAETNLTTSEFTIEKRLVSTTSSGPDLVLSDSEILFPANEDFIYVDENLTLTSSGAQFYKATVAITDNYIQGEDELAVTELGDGMQADFDAATGVLTVTGFANAYEYEQVLQSIIFVDSTGYRTPGPIGITYRVFDGLTVGDLETLTLNIESAPYITGDIDNVLVYDQGRELEMIGAGLQIESQGLLTGAIVTISEGFNANEDELTFAPKSGITGSFNAATGTLTLTGSASTQDYQSALESIGYRSNRYNPVAGERVVSFQVRAGNAISNLSMALISVDPDSVAPQVSVGSTTTFTENGAPVPIAPSLAITAKDPVSPLGAEPEKLYGAEVAIMNYVDGEDFLSYSATGNITGEFDTNEGRIYFVGEGTLEEYQALLRSVVYSNTSDAPTTTPRKISIRLLDSGANGLSNQVITTEVVVGLPDPVQLAFGSADDIVTLTNEEFVSLGLDDLVFAGIDPSNASIELKATLNTLPSEELGRITLADGTPVELGRAYPLTDLAGMKFEPTPGAFGTIAIDYSVAVFDTSTGAADSTKFTDSLSIRVEGISTTTEAEAWAAQAYRDLLGSNPDVNTLRSMADQLTDKLKRIGRSSNGFANASDVRRDVLATLIASESYRRTVISKFYADLFQRSVTSDEISIRLRELDGGLSFSGMRGELLGTSEYFALHKEEGFSSYVKAIYLELFERAPTDSELTTSIRKLQAGTSITSLANTLTRQSEQDDTKLEGLAADLLNREFAEEDRSEFDFSDRASLLTSVLSSEEYYDLFAVPTGAAKQGPRATNEFPAVGKLGDIAGDKAGGTLIAPQFVLVAAHSVVGLPPGQLTFTIGGVQHRTAKVFVHPDYSADSIGTESSNDIAILKLDSLVTDVQPLSLSGKAPRLGDQLDLVGFGQQDGLAYGMKRVGATPPVDYVSPTIFRWTHESDSQNDSDPGDSGSPLLVKVGNAYEVIGIVSGGTSSGELGDIATNVRVDAYLDWIRSIVPSIVTTDTADAPSMTTDVESVYLDENSGPQSIAFQLSSDEEVAVSVSSDSPQMFKSMNVNYDGRGFGEVLYETNVNQRGTAKLFVTATSSEGVTVRTLTVTTEERNDPPTMDLVLPIAVDKSPGPISVPLSGLSAGVGETGNVRISILSVSPQNFFSAVSISQSAEGGEAIPTTLNITPANNRVGAGTVELEIRDAGPDGKFNTADDQTSTSPVTVTTSVTKAPTLDAISSQRYVFPSGVQSIPLTGIGSGDELPQLLRFAVTSSNPNIALFEVIRDDSDNASTASLKVLPQVTGRGSVSVRVTDPGDDGAFDTLDDRYFERVFSLNVADSAQNWHNVETPLDVSGDGEISPLDVLLVVNYLNEIGASELPTRSQPERPFVDTNGDGSCSPIDAFLVVEWLNSLAGEGEGLESLAAASSQPQSATLSSVSDATDTALAALFEFSFEEENARRKNQRR